MSNRGKRGRGGDRGRDVGCEPVGDAEPPRTFGDLEQIENRRKSCITMCLRERRDGVSSDLAVSEAPRRAFVFTLWRPTLEDMRSLLDCEIRDSVLMIDFQLEYGGEGNDYAPHVQGHFVMTRPERPMFVQRNVFQIDGMWIYERFGMLRQVYHYCHAPHNVGCSCKECEMMGARDEPCECKDCCSEREKLARVVARWGSVDGRALEFYGEVVWKEMVEVMGNVGMYSPVSRGIVKLSSSGLSWMGNVRQIVKAGLAQGKSYKGIVAAVNEYDPDFSQRDPPRYRQMLQDVWDECAASVSIDRRGDAVMCVLMCNASGTGKSASVKQIIKDLDISDEDIFTLSGQQDNYSYAGESVMLMDEVNGRYFKQSEIKLLLNNEGFQLKVNYLGYRKVYFKYILMTTQYKSPLHWYDFGGSRGKEEAIAMVRRLVRHRESQIWYFEVDSASKQTRATAVTEIYRRFVDENSSAGRAVYLAGAKWTRALREAAASGQIMDATIAADGEPCVEEPDLERVFKLAVESFRKADDDGEASRGGLPEEAVILSKISEYVYGGSGCRLPGASGRLEVVEPEYRPSVIADGVQEARKWRDMGPEIIEFLEGEFWCTSDLKWELCKGIPGSVDRQTRLFSVDYSWNSEGRVIHGGVEVRDTPQPQWRVGPLTLYQQRVCIDKGFTTGYAPRLRACSQESLLSGEGKEKAVMKRWEKASDGSIGLHIVDGV